MTLRPQACSDAVKASGEYLPGRASSSEDEFRWMDAGSVQITAIAMCLLAPMFAFAAEPATSAAKPRFMLKSSSTEAAPQQSGRYALRARFAPVESAGELREGENFTLIGRFAKGTVSCDFTAIFSNSFEGN